MQSDSERIAIVMNRPVVRWSVFDCLERMKCVSIRFKLYFLPEKTMHHYRYLLKIKYCLVCVTIIFYLIAPLGMFEGHVMCFGDDGHVMVEPAPIGNQCGHFPSATPQSTSHRHSAASGNGLSTDRCSSCIDIPLFFNFAGHCACPDWNTLLLVKTPALFTHPFFHSAFASHGVGHSPVKPLMHEPFPLDSIRSVILLI